VIRRVRHPLPFERNPAAVYLAKLKASGRQPQKHALDVGQRLPIDDL
jgi:hypothetical protein